jgi:hypothetical protein
MIKNKETLKYAFTHMLLYKFELADARWGLRPQTSGSGFSTVNKGGFKNIHVLKLKINDVTFSYT